MARKTITELRDAVAKKETIAKKIEYFTSLKTWMQELFVPLIGSIERQVLLSVYAQFNEHFQKWFDMLIEDESMQVKLNEDFTPIITQHGFDTNIANLSGGERTSVALSYRLALNKVLNDYFGSIHTKGLLILDEPTDGFSSQQLDKLRDVLDELAIEQLIIVSHEQKLEPLADHLLAVSKTPQGSIVRQ